MKKIFIFGLATLLLAACAPQGIQIPQSPALRFLEIKSGLIAYIGADGNVYLTDQAAGSITPLTTDMTPETQANMAYQQPTWSQAGDRLAFIRLQQNGSSLTTEIFVTDVESETTRSIYTSDTDFPIYIYWSPDGANVSALTTTPSRGVLALKNIPIDGGEARILDTGNPLYWSWAPDGTTLFLHKNGGNPDVPNQLSFLKVDERVTEFVTENSPASFQAPAWSPDGAYILLTALSEAGAQEILLADSTGALIKSVGEFDVNAALGWSPDSRQFAYIAGSERMQQGTLGKLHVRNVDNDEEIIVDENAIAFFWSPDSLEVAYLVPFVAETEDTNQQQLLFRLLILDVASGESREVVTFQPSESFLAVVPYFDQYHQSITIWSPDSNNLVISFIDQSGSPGLAVVPTSGITEPRLLVEGTYAVWSWK